MSRHLRSFRVVAVAGAISLADVLGETTAAPPLKAHHDSSAQQSKEPADRNTAVGRIEDLTVRFSAWRTFGGEGGSADDRSVPAGRPARQWGMGRVFLGVSAGGRPVAVKVVRAELAADPEFRNRFGRKVAAARRVSGVFTATVVDADVDGPMVRWPDWLRLMFPGLR